MCAWRRQDTWSDLQLFGVVNLGVIFLFGWLKTHLVDAADAVPREQLDSRPVWTSIYEVCAALSAVAPVIVGSVAPVDDLLVISQWERPWELSWRWGDQPTSRRCCAVVSVSRMALQGEVG